MRESTATTDNIMVPVPSGRRHSDLSSLLTLKSKHNQLALQRCHACQACLSLLQRSREGSYHRPSIVTPLHLPSCEHSGTVPSPSFGRQRGSSDCSDFSLLQQSLFNIIGRKAAPCHMTTHSNPLLQSSAAPRPVCSDGDIRMKSHLLTGGLVVEKESPKNFEDSLCAGEQQCSGAETGVVGHSSRHRFSLFPGANSCLTNIYPPVVASESFCIDPVRSPRGQSHRKHFFNCFKWQCFANFKDPHDASKLNFVKK